METLVYVVTYKREPFGVTATRPFTNPKAANDFAYAIELDGGVAVVKPETKGHIGIKQTPSQLEGTWE